MRRPVRFLAIGAAMLVAAAIPAAWLQVTPGSISALPRGQRLRAAALELLRDRVGAGALTPTEIVVDTGQGGGVRTPELKRALARLTNATFHDPEAFVTASGPRAPYVDATSRYARVYVVGRHEYGAEQSQQLVRRIRRDARPRRALPGGRARLRRRRPGAGRRLPRRARTRAFPWLVAAALAAHLPRRCCARSARCSCR